MDDKPLDRLMPLVYDELRALAAKILQREDGAKVVQPTSLVHETYLRLRDQRKVDWQDRAHFFRIAARTMRADSAAIVRRVSSIWLCSRTTSGWCSR